MISRRALDEERRRRTEASGRKAWQRAESETSPAERRRWLERAHRLVPADQNLTFLLAMARLRDGDATAALELFETMARRHGGREPWAGVVATALVLGRLALACEAAGRLLGGYAADPATIALARRLEAHGFAWCGITDTGRLVGSMGVPCAVMDDRPVRLGPGQRLAGWRRGTRLEVAAAVPVLGSPIDLAAIRALEGFVERRGGDLVGWAWHPGAPELAPRLRVRFADGREVPLLAEDLSVEVEGSAPLRRLRGLRLEDAPADGLRVIGPDGRDLLGSPVAAARPGPPPRGTGVRRPAAGGGVVVVIPVYRGREATLDCVESVLATLRPGDRVVVVNDASPEPGLVTALEALAARGAIALRPSCAADPRRNLGFPGAANAGMREAAGRDLVLLNSDTLVFPGWLGALQQAAHSAPDIGTVTPAGNEASIFSMPDPDGQTVSRAEAAGLARLAAVANGGVTVEVPTAHGFCMFIRADCLARTGMFREDVFAQGYGEENDFTERARGRGFRQVAAPGVYVAHTGGASFGPVRSHLLARNLELLEALHPGYRARIAAFMAADALRDSRRRLDAARWREATRPGAVLLLTHRIGGGTSRVVATREAAIRARGLRAVRLAAEEGEIRVGDGEVAYPGLVYRLPGDFDLLAELLAADRPVGGEVHQLLGHHHGVMELFRHFRIPYDVFVHDYAWLCPRIVLTTGEGRYCGEPAVQGCERCIRSWGRAIEERISPRRLRARSAAELQQAARVVVPSADAARRVRRHFPGLLPAIEPWDVARPVPRAAHRGGRIAVIGAIGVDKGFDVLLACARDSAARQLGLEFVVVGYTVDDDVLLASGAAFVTGPFEAEETDRLIRAQRARLAFLPSVWPETWCFALSDAWAAGLDAAVFDIGTPAERVRASGRGWVLPLGLPPPRVNDALLNIQPRADTPVGTSGPELALAEGSAP